MQQFSTSELSKTDDIALLSNSTDHIIELYNVFKMLINELDMKINEEKSKCMVFGMNRKINYNTYEDIPLEVVNEFDYLEHVITSNLCDKKDILSKF